MRALVWWLPAAIMLSAASADGRNEPAELCATLARAVERAENIPTGLVEAVALAESGRWFPEARRSRPWPWTVTSGPDSFYLASKEAALAKVRELRATGRTNIDVGCMQVNLGYHEGAFQSLDQALEPASNVAYGASFLKRLREETRSWGRATARYHSGDPERGEAYRAKVYRLWNQVRRQTVAERREALVLTGSPATERVPGAIGAAGPSRFAGSPRLKSPSLVRSAANGGLRILRGQ